MIAKWGFIIPLFLPYLLVNILQERAFPLSHLFINPFNLHISMYLEIPLFIQNVTIHYGHYLFFAQLALDMITQPPFMAPP